jgi:hypothetical protein
MKVSEHSRAIRFFTLLANDVPEYRAQVLSSRGIPLLIQHIRVSCTWTTANNGRTNQDSFDLCLVFAMISSFGWCVPTLVQCDICPTLVSLLVCALNFINTRL